MSDPERLFNDAPSALTRRMLSAAREEQPPEALAERTLLAVGAAGAVLGATASASGAAAAGATTGAKAGLLVMAKWLAVGALGGAFLTTVVYQARDALRQPAPAAATQPPSQRSEPHGRGPESPAVPGTVTEPIDEPAEGATSRSAPRASKAEPDRSLELAAEVAALDAARQALAGGDPGRALSLLDAYRDRFPEARLLPEALHVRMEALYEKGDRAAAARIAERLLAGFPKSPHAARARQIADEARR